MPFNDLEALAAAVDESVCAVLLEPIQGEGGVCLPDADYFKGVRRLCDEKNLLLVLDEVQSGLGRTGRLFAHEHYGIKPDVMTLAKALAGGLPMGALLATEAVAAAFVPGTHASTFGAGPVHRRRGQNRGGAFERRKAAGRGPGQRRICAKGPVAAAGQISGNQRSARPGPDVGPGAGPRGRAGGDRLPGTGPVAQLHPGQRHPAAAAVDCRDG